MSWELWASLAIVGLTLFYLGLLAFVVGTEQWRAQRATIREREQQAEWERLRQAEHAERIRRRRGLGCPRPGAKRGRYRLTRYRPERALGGS